jgi:hypothetical protein
MRQVSSVGILFLGIGILLLFFWKLAFTHLILARGDTLLYFYPYWDYRAQSLLAGRLPLWNPYLFMGAPFLANSQAGVLYPLNWPLIYFPAPIAVKISILLHLLIAASGAYAFARRALGQSAMGALLSAMLFALGGYLTSQVEHVNQLQGLAWFPWLLVSGQWSGISEQKTNFQSFALRVLPSAVILSLQLLAGHSQSAMISLVGVGVYALVLAARSPSPRHLVSPLILLAAFVSLALLLSAAQLLPTLELSGQSLRGGGLPLREALSFSLDPRLLGRALLPGYARGLFSEYVAYVGIVGLALAGIGMRRTPQRLAMLGLAVLGLGFALGAFNPLYAVLATLPPFNLFRAPARWLFLFAFGVALLAGYGLDELRLARRVGISRFSRLGFVIFLFLLTPLAGNLTPSGETGPIGLPAVRDWLGWLLAVVGVLLLMRAPPRWRAPGAIIFALVELFAAAQVLPYNHLTTPEAYSSIRPAMTQLLPRSSAVESVDPSSRFLSMSALRFDPGDLAELRGELEPQLPPDAVYDAIVATKNKEVLSPNLPLAWGVSAVDGFDGGILPLRRYADFTALFTGAPSPDGRLRENLDTAPDPRLLALVNARYLITDKVNDAWVDDVFYDQQFTVTLAEGETTTVAHVPRFQATALGLVLEAPSGSFTITFADNSITHYTITSSRVRFGHPGTPLSITLAGPLTVRGLSLIDERSGAFQSLTLGPYRLAHSGDVKIYDLLTVLPRAFVAPEAIVISASRDAAARAALADPRFDPASTVILASGVGGYMGRPVGRDMGRHVGRPVGRHVGRHVGRDLGRHLGRHVGRHVGRHIGLPLPTVTDYEPEYVRLTAEGPGYLLLTDAYYPGWVATLDGRPTPILRADIMFRAVELPEGIHTVEFRFEPRPVTIGLWVSGLAWASVLLTLLVLAFRNKKAGAPKASSA